MANYEDDIWISEKQVREIQARSILEQKLEVFRRGQLLVRPYKLPVWRPKKEGACLKSSTLMH